MKTIIIISGEGDQGTIKSYDGKDSPRAIRARLTRDRCGGDRWARAYRLDHVTSDYTGIYYEIDGEDMREISPLDID